MTARGCCNAKLVAVIAELKKRQASELNPDVRRGLTIAIHTLASERDCHINTSGEESK
jgi:hypothetical protein